ncbi:leucine-rich repeat domain-containing protein [Metamycoplasma hyosynoviae]|uniref:leucine-rich repeat domain-containing protein n=1 Tax=Metamycoplasma hyosynoviae TaxID=29559 RepID=UPI00235883BC|nr:leucine-rich repeat domain-containing protein [Metamycoplasma hyosynoviae]MDC8962348.1 leucine-rich repeat domain-containing protein [Metamycoplasma hyosynoviae]MDD1372811.1 leucine-rich repeat domain-containing protein [Metamycoplasma hyosynoviae]MDD7893547.1 leucine-rich repeat domain-containing protein [Metamycoplasma hyosynoviae]MDD7894470.1 leucine-rich repeat domain-containing protein [Metamycoplasma hyosynoviae]MDD7907234.1 leucine-rich repeat domain-containing protein [Metamycoplasm
MKEQEQKNLNTQEPKQQNQDKVKTQNPKTKVIAWSAAGAAVAALSSVVSITTVFSNQRKVSFLDKVLQSIKIDVKDKETKTKEDIKTIGDFVASGLNSKLYELIVETEEDQVNKQPLDKDKPYTTFRTKFAIRNKVTKAQSNYRIFEFRGIKPPKEKAELNELGKISEKEEDRVNDKVKIEFINFNRSEHLASAVATRDKNGKFEHFNIYLKQDNEDALLYDIVNIDVTTNDNEAKAIISYQLKVKSVDDEKFTSDKLSIEFKDFAIPSTQLTHYLNNLDIKYKDASSTYIQDANREDIVQGTTLSNPNYNLEFENFEKLETENKVKAKVKIVDKKTNESSETRDIEIAGFYDYEKFANEVLNKVTFNYNDKDTTFATDINKDLLTNNLSSLENNKDLVVFDLSYRQENEEDSSKRTNLLVSCKLLNTKTGFKTEEKNYLVSGFKNYLIQSELDNYAKTIVLDVDSKDNKYAKDVNSFGEIKRVTFDSTKYEFNLNDVIISQPVDLETVKVNFTIKEKNGKQNIKSSQQTFDIQGFALPIEKLNQLIENVSITMPNASSTFAYEMWDDTGWDKLAKEQLSDKCEFNTHSVKQIDKDKIRVEFTIKQKDKTLSSNVKAITLENFKVNDPLEEWKYSTYSYNGHQVATLNKFLDSDYKDVTVPAYIDGYAVKKASYLFVNDTYTLKLHKITFSEGIEELENTFLNYLRVGEITLPKSIKKITNGMIKCPNITKLSLYDNIETIDGLIDQYKENIEIIVNESSIEKKLKLTTNDNLQWLISEDETKLFKVFNKNNSSIEELKIKNSIVEITPLALHNLNIKKLIADTSSKLEKLPSYILDNINVIEEINFQNANKLKVIPQAFITSKNLKTVKLPDGLEEILANAFIYSNKITSLNLPSTLKFIGDSALFGLEECSFSDDIKKLAKIEIISKYALGNTKTNEVDLTISSNLKKIDSYAFHNEKNFIHNIKTLTLPNNCSNIEIGSVIIKKSESFKINVRGVSTKPEIWAKDWFKEWNESDQTAGGIITWNYTG